MNAFVAILLAISALGFWVWVGGSAFVCLSRIFVADAFPNARYSALASYFFYPFVLLIIAAVLSR